MGHVPLTVCSSWKGFWRGRGELGGGAKEKVNFSHQSPCDINDNSNLESITKINKDIAGESAADTSDGGTDTIKVLIEETQSQLLNEHLLVN